MKYQDLTPLGNVTVYVDMDGVIVDTYNYIAKLLNAKHYDLITGDEWDNFYNSVNSYRLFAELPMFPSANALLNLVTRYAGKYSILSSPLNFDVKNSIRGKQTWLSLHHTVNAENVIFDANKEKYAFKNGIPNVLIDDSTTNIQKWEIAGGIPIYYRADKDAISVVEQGLRTAIKKINTSL